MKKRARNDTVTTSQAFRWIRIASWICSWQWRWIWICWQKKQFRLKLTNFTLLTVVQMMGIFIIEVITIKLIQMCPTFWRKPGSFKCKRKFRRMQSFKFQAEMYSQQKNQANINNAFLIVFKWYYPRTTPKLFNTQQFMIDLIIQNRNLTQMCNYGLNPVSFKMHSMEAQRMG